MKNMVSTRFAYILMALEDAQTLITYFYSDNKLSSMVRLVAFFFGDDMRHEQASEN